MQRLLQLILMHGSGLERVIFVITIEARKIGGNPLSVTI
jgi:hypothetical protein